MHSPARPSPKGTLNATGHADLIRQVIDGSTGL
jgi:hypothetical protein